MSRPSLSVKGFTLIEIVFGMAILSLATVAFLASYEVTHRSKRSLDEDSVTTILTNGVHKILTNQEACDQNFKQTGVPAAPASITLNSLGFPERGPIPAQDFIAKDGLFLKRMLIKNITLASMGAVTTTPPYKELFRITLEVGRPEPTLSFGSPKRDLVFDLVMDTSDLSTTVRDLTKCNIPPTVVGGGYTLQEACSRIRGVFDPVNEFCDVGPTVCRDLGVPYVDQGFLMPNSKCDPVKLRERLMAGMISGQGCGTGTFVKGFNADGTPICLQPQATPSPVTQPITSGCGVCYLNMAQPCAVSQLVPMPSPSPTSSFVPQYRIYENGLLSTTVCLPSPDPSLLPERCVDEARPCGP